MKRIEISWRRAASAEGWALLIEVGERKACLIVTDAFREAIEREHGHDDNAALVAVCETLSVLFRTVNAENIDRANAARQSKGEVH